MTVAPSGGQQLPVGAIRYSGDLRFVERDGKRILQQGRERLQYDYSEDYAMEKWEWDGWQDVPFGQAERWDRYG